MDRYLKENFGFESEFDARSERTRRSSQMLLRRIQKQKYKVSCSDRTDADQAATWCAGVPRPSGGPAGAGRRGPPSRLFLDSLKIL